MFDLTVFIETPIRSAACPYEHPFEMCHSATNGRNVGGLPRRFLDGSGEGQPNRCCSAMSSASRFHEESASGSAIHFASSASASLPSPKPACQLAVRHSLPLSC